MISQNLADYIEQNARRRGDRVALRDQDGEMRYAALGPAMISTAGWLQHHGVARGQVVGIAMRDGIDYVVAMLAIIRAGAILLPMDPRWTSTEKENVARAFSAAFVVTDAPETGQITATHVLTFDPAAMTAAHPFTPPANFSADEPLLMSLSSGTTGMPKGPRITHRQMMLRHYSEWVSLGFHQDDVNLCATPLYFGGGRGFTLSYLMGGATVVFCPPPYRPEMVAELIRTQGVTSSFLVPTLLRRIREAPEEIREAVQSLRLLICSGSALHPDERADLLENVNGTIVNFYASTEGGGVSILYPGELGEVARSVGRPILGSELSITDNDGQPLGAGEIGHIRQRAPWHPDGFYRNPEETARYFQDGWYLPGDLGYLDEQGYLFITGRSKDMIIRGGVNIYPNEIEATLIAHPHVSDAAVVGVPSAHFGEEVAAFVVPAVTGLDLAALADHCRAGLAAYKVPTRFEVLDELPRNSGGKVIKPDLVRRLQEVPEPGA